jgi:hypothetical protein
VIRNHLIIWYYITYADYSAKTLIIIQLVNKFPALMNSRFITLFTKAHHSALSKPIPTSEFCFFEIHSNIIVSCVWAHLWSTIYPRGFRPEFSTHVFQAVFNMANPFFVWFKLANKSYECVRYESFDYAVFSFVYLISTVTMINLLDGYDRV